MLKAAWERPVALLLALSKAARVRTRLLFAGRASENAVSLQMRGFYKAQDTENGHICRSSHAVYKVTSAARGCLSIACLQRQWGTLASEIIQKREKCWWEMMQKKRKVSISFSALSSVRGIHTELFRLWWPVLSEWTLSNLKSFK